MQKIRNGLDIPISGSPEHKITDFKKPRSVALVGADYHGLKPSMLVKEGDRVKIGQPLFEDKKNKGVLFTSPGGGVIESVNRGDKRALQSVVIEIDDSEEEESFIDIKTEDLSNHNASSIRENLIKSGLWTSFRTRPFSKIPKVDSDPKSIFINCMDTNPLAMDPEIIINNNTNSFKLGLRAINLLYDCPVHICVKNKTDLAGLIRRLLKEKSLIRLRLSSIEPLELYLEIIVLVATSPKMAKHFHVPLQSGSGRVLRLMRRPYQPDEYFRLVERIRKNVPNAAIGADLMVGFPTETAKDHALTRDLILNSPLTYLHVFPFSSRPGTQAAHIQDTIPKTISDQRSLDLRKIGEQKNRSFRKSQIGRSISVITLETKKSEGTTKALSSNFLRVNLPDLSVQPNQFLNVQVTSINKTGVRAIPVNASFG